jgi:hypothetical protein
MGKTGSITERILASASIIATGRKFRDIPKKESKGRVTFNKGINQAMQAFKDANASNDLKAIIQAQLTFVKQDLSFCDPKNNYAAKSFQASVIDLQESLNFLAIFETKNIYQYVDKSYSTRRREDRVESLPKDVVHKTLTSEITRLSNSLNSNMANPIEREFVLQRIENMRHARKLYIKIQKKVLGYVCK